MYVNTPLYQQNNHEGQGIDDYTKIAERLRMVSMSNYRHPTGAVSSYTGPAFQLPWNFVLKKAYPIK